jgi:hypothetical protein
MKLKPMDLGIMSSVKSVISKVCSGVLLFILITMRRKQSRVGFSMYCIPYGSIGPSHEVFSSLKCVCYASDSPDPPQVVELPDDAQQHIRAETERFLPHSVASNASPIGQSTRLDFLTHDPKIPTALIPIGSNKSFSMTKRMRSTFRYHIPSQQSNCSFTNHWKIDDQIENG